MTVAPSLCLLMTVCPPWNLPFEATRQPNPTPTTYWSPTSLSMWVDNNSPFFEIRNKSWQIPQVDMQLIINFAVGGGFTTIPNPDTFPHYFGISRFVWKSLDYSGPGLPPVNHSIPVTSQTTDPSSSVAPFSSSAAHDATSSASSSDTSTSTATPSTTQQSTSTEITMIPSSTSTMISSQAPLTSTNSAITLESSQILLIVSILVGFFRFI
eukprot:Sdes_comp13519_c0_seq1m3214